MEIKEVKILDLTKYSKGIKVLEARKAPSYIIEAYKEGFAVVINEYYKPRTKKTKVELNESSDFINKVAKSSKHSFIREAINQRDNKFLKLFYQITNMDILSGEKLPPNYSKLVKAGFKLADDTMKQALNKIR